MWFRGAVAVLAVLVGLLLSGCAERPSDASNGPPVASNATRADGAPASVLAPSPIADALAEAHSALGFATRVETYAPGCLAEALEGASVEVVVAASGPELAAAGLPSSASDPIGRLPVVLAVRRGNPLKLKSVQDLGREDVTSIAAASSDRDSAAALFAEAAAAAGVGDQCGAKLHPVESSDDGLASVAADEAQVAVAYLPQVMFGKRRNDCGIGAFLPKEGAYAADILVVPTEESHAGVAEAYLAALRSRAAQDALARFSVEPAVPRGTGDATSSLLIPCGAGLQPAMDAIGAAYLQRTGVRTDFSYAGSGMLMAQLDFTRQADLYMPGEAFWVTLAERKGLVSESLPVVYFTPVLAVPTGNPADVHTLEDLARPGVRVALGDPEALAIGPLTKRILERAGIWEAAQPNVVMYAGCLPELANCIAMRGADVGIVWDALALQHADKMEMLEIEPEVNEAAEVMLATLTCAADPDAAKAFLEFAASEEAIAIFEQNGFRTEPPVGIRLAPREGPDA